MDPEQRTATEKRVASSAQQAEDELDFEVDVGEGAGDGLDTANDDSVVCPSLETTQSAAIVHTDSGNKYPILHHPAGSYCEKHATVRSLTPPLPDL